MELSSNLESCSDLKLASRFKLSSHLGVVFSRALFMNLAQEPKPQRPKLWMGETSLAGGGWGPRAVLLIPHGYTPAAAIPAP